MWTVIWCVWLILLIFIRELQLVLPLRVFLSESHEFSPSQSHNPSVLRSAVIQQHTRFSPTSPSNGLNMHETRNSRTEAWWKRLTAVCVCVCVCVPCRHPLETHLLCFPWCSSNAGTSNYLSCDVAARTMTASAYRAVAIPAVLNSSPRAPPLCTFRMLLLSLQTFVLFERKCPAKWTSHDIPPWFQFEANVFHS